jgi:hypothetical protein
MSYLVICTFDLENASSEDYVNAYEIRRNWIVKEIFLIREYNYLQILLLWVNLMVIHHLQ